MSTNERARVIVISAFRCSKNLHQAFNSYMGCTMDPRLFSLLSGVAIVFAVVGCEGSSLSNPASSAPTPVVAPAPTPFVTVSGTVWIHGTAGVTRYANGRMFGWVQEPSRGRTTGPVPTGADGRFSFTVPPGVEVRLQSSADGFQPCQVVVRANTDVTQDIHVVADRQQLGSRLPAELLARTPLLSGVVYEQAADGRRTPLADARLSLDSLGGLGFVAATTLTDAEGRYILCGLDDDTSTYVFAWMEGFDVFESRVTLAGNTTLDIELHR